MTETMNYCFRSALMVLSVKHKFHRRSLRNPLLALEKSVTFRFAFKGFLFPETVFLLSEQLFLFIDPS